MYQRFTDRARKVMQLAIHEARRLRHEYIGTEHILLGLVAEGSGVAANVLKNLDINLNRIRREVERLVQVGPGQVTVGELPKTPHVKKVIEYAIEEARNLNHTYVGTEHLLLGLLREQEGVAVEVLGGVDLCDLWTVRNEVENLLGYRPYPPEIPDLPDPVLKAIAQLDGDDEQLQLRKEQAISDQDFERAALVRNQQDRLRMQKENLLLHWPVDYVADPAWLAWNDEVVRKLAAAIGHEKRWADLPILADALEEAGCTDEDMLHHCRAARPHDRRCWVVNLLLDRLDVHLMT